MKATKRWGNIYKSTEFSKYTSARSPMSPPSRPALPSRTKSAVLLLVITILGMSLVGLLGPAASDAAAQDNTTDDQRVNQSNQTIENVAYSGTGVIRANNETAYAFRDENATVTVEFDSGNATGDYFACLEARPNASEEDVESDPVELACSGTHNTSTTGGEASFEINVRDWTEVRPGELPVDVVVVQEEPAMIGADEIEVMRANRTVHILEKDGDASNNGLTNEEELRRGTNFAVSDTTRSGLNDYEEVYTYGTDPLDVDTDGDGIPDSTEVLINTDPTDPKTTPLLLGIATIPVTVLMGLFGLVVKQFEPELPDLDRDDRDGARASGETAPPISGDGPTAGGERRDGASQPAQPEPVTDEDRILQILEENGGRVRQQAIVQRTDWSKSKVSRRLSKMEDDDLISKISVGRENLVTFHDEEPEAAKAPFESE